jgi:hypothetical protein
MDPAPDPETRIQTLETSLRRTRRAAILLGLGVTVLAGAALVPQAADEVRTGRLVLTSDLGTPAVVIVAGPPGSLIIQTPSGEEVLRLGGPPGRRIIVR